jgi:3-dehydroquinate dehydratase/shikimate dehydrogenase
VSVSLAGCLHFDVLTFPRFDLYPWSVALIAVSIFVSDASEVEAALRRALRAAEVGAQIVEWRVDELAGSAEGQAAAAQLVDRSPLPAILTCRGEREGGMFKGSEADRLELLQHVLTQPNRPRYVDLEFDAFAALPANERERLIALLRSEASATRLILSSHDFADRPADLMRRVHRMSAEPACDVVKIAWRARSLRDNIEAFDLLRERNKPTIALCMGEFGVMSRVLQGKFGGFITYAADAAGDETALGQPTVEELVHRYRFASINRDTQVFGVIGWPVAHSLSPLVHNAGFEAISYDGVYLPMPVPTEWEHFKATLSSLLDCKELHFRGASVTMPHKQHLVRFVKERGGVVEQFAERVGVANTLIVNDDRSLECINSDGPAIAAALTEGMHIESGDLRERNVAILGTGGMARSAALALSDVGATVVIFSREKSRAEQVVSELRSHVSSGKVVAGDRAKMDCNCFDVIINCTPVGMTNGPAPNDSPLPENVTLGATTIVLDTVYAPTETPLIKAARAAGATAIIGMSVFVLQAAMQFERWTGKDVLQRFVQFAPGSARN